MFSTNELQYIDTLIPTYAKEGYKYYVVYSNTVVNSGYGYSTQPDIYAVFSKEAISAEDAYTYVVKDSSILVAVRCSDYSSSSSAVNTSRVVVTDYAAQTLSINEYEHVYTNAEFESYALQPDYTLSSGGGNIVATETIGYVITIAVLVCLFSRLFNHRR